MKKPDKTDEATDSEKEYSADRVPTYIPGFDSLIEGGLRRNSSNLIVGSAGSGKTIFAVQFLVGGLEKGDKCLYVTFEEKKSQFYRNMKEFGWDLAKYEEQGLLTFLEYSPSKVRTMLEEGGGEIESIVVKKKITRIVVDSITSFALLFNDELAKREASLDLFNLINSWNCTSLLTYEEETIDLERAPSSNALEFEVDSIINIYFIRDKESRDRYIEIIKMRGTNHSRGIHELKIAEKGISVDEKPIKTKLSY